MCGNKCHREPHCQCSRFRLCFQLIDGQITWHCMVLQLCRIPRKYIKLISDQRHFKKMNYTNSFLVAYTKNSVSKIQCDLYKVLLSIDVVL